MNLLRWKRKTKNKVKFKTVLLVIFSLIMSTFAWFAYSKVIQPTLNMHLASWNMEYSINGVKQPNLISIGIPTLYPTMPEYIVSVDINNNGEKKAELDYHIETIDILGISYQVLYEGEQVSEGITNYVRIASPVLQEEIKTNINQETGEEIQTKREYIEGSIIYDYSKFPFTIMVEHSTQIDSAKTNDYDTKIPGKGYLKIITNWIGDNQNMDTEWGHKVGEYLEANPGTSAVNIGLTIDSYQVDDLGVIEPGLLPSNPQTTPFLPQGFKKIPGTNLDNGLAIKDTKTGNEFVWIEVPKTAEVYKLTGLNEKEFFNEGLQKIEQDLKNYTSQYPPTQDVYTEYNDLGIGETAFLQNKRKLLESIYKNGGFYIGRYETGIFEKPRTYNTSSYPKEKPVIQNNAYPFNFVTLGQAQSVVSDMLPPTGRTYSLIYGFQWNLILKYLEEKGNDITKIRQDSTEWGNFINKEVDIIRTGSKYSKDQGKTWQESPYYKNDEEEVLTTTGGNTGHCMQNIYDLAGNVTEWIYEVKKQNGETYGGVGGNCSEKGQNTFMGVSNIYKVRNVSGIGHKMGFRISMY